MKYCPNCLRHTIHDTTDPEAYGGTRTPMFLVCGYCGFATAIEGEK